MMIRLILIAFLTPFSTSATEVADAPVPIFLQSGYSTILEFDEAPAQVVLGDTQSFQVEKLNNSVVIRPLIDEATSNMFIYFKKQDPRLFILSVSEEAKPTLYKKFVSMKALAKVRERKPVRYKRATRLVKALFNEQKDYLTLEIAMSADSSASITPIWDKTRLAHKDKTIKPETVWAERQVVQKDSQVLARFIFKRPDVPRTLKDTRLLIPLKGYKNPVYLTLNKGKR